MNPGDLIFVHGTSLVDRIIRWVTKSQYSHVAIYIGDGKIIDAHPFRKVGINLISIYSGDYDIKSLPVTVTHEQLNVGLYWLYLQRGRHYSYWSDFVILLRCLFGIKLSWHEGASIICSRLGRDFLFRCGLPIPDENMSPEDLFEWLEQFRRDERRLVR